MYKNGVVLDGDRVDHQIIFCRVIQNFAGGQIKSTAVQRAFDQGAIQITVAQSCVFMGAHFIGDIDAAVGVCHHDVSIGQRYAAHVAYRDVAKVTNAVFGLHGNIDSRLR